MCETILKDKIYIFLLSENFLNIIYEFLKLYNRGEKVTGDIDNQLIKNKDLDDLPCKMCFIDFY